MTTRSFYIPAEGKEYVLNVSHPIDGPMRIYGAFWTDDAFTFALIRDGLLVATGETDPNPPANAGPEAITQQRQVNSARKKMRIMNPPVIR